MRLTLIRGLPGSGKSTLAREMAAQSGAIHVEADMFHVRDGVYSFDPDNIRVAHQRCYDVAELAIYAKADVIVSNTFTRGWEVLPYRTLALARDAEFQVITCKGEFESSHNVPRDVLDAMRARWEEDV